MTASATTTRKATKVERKETTQAMTAAQSAALAKLVKASQDSITGAETKTRELDDIMGGIADFKVFAARALYRLSLHPATIAKGGPTKGQPALTTMATFIGRPAQTLETYWKGAKALAAVPTMAGKSNLALNTGKVSQRERDIVMAGFKSESARVSAATAKAKGKGPKGTGTGTGKAVTFATVDGQLDAVIQSVTKLLAAGKLSPEQEKVLFSKLDEVTDLIEKASGK